MPSARALVAALSAPVLGLVACGGSVPTARCTPLPSTSPPAAVAGQLTAFADRAVVSSGGTVAAGVRVSGPLSYQAPCAAPLSLIVVDRADIHVDSESPPAPRGTPCGAVALASGQTAEYDVLWNPDPTLPSGPYRLVLGLGDQPQLVVTVRVGLDFGGAC